MCFCAIKSLFYFPLRLPFLILLHLVELINILELSTILLTGFTYPVMKHFKAEFIVIVAYAVYLGIQLFFLLVAIICLHCNKRSILQHSLLIGIMFQSLCIMLKFLILIKINKDQQKALTELCEEAKSPEVIIGNHKDQKEAQNGCVFMTLIFLSDLTTLHLCFYLLAALVLFSYLKFEVIRETDPEPTIWDSCDVFHVTMADRKESNVSHKNEQNKREQKHIASKLPTQPTFSGFGLRIMFFRIWCFGSTASSEVDTNQQTVEKFSATCTKITINTPVDVAMTRV